MKKYLFYFLFIISFQSFATETLFIPEDVNLYVDGNNSLTRMLPGYSVDNRYIDYRLLTPPQTGELVINGRRFTYNPDGFSGNDYFVMQSTVVENNGVTKVNQTRVNLLPFKKPETKYQQYVFKGHGTQYLLTHRGQLYRWGEPHNQYYVRVATPRPELFIEGNWVGAAYIEDNNVVVLLKGDGTLWMVGDRNYADQNIPGGRYFLHTPVQIGTDRDWEQIFETSIGVGAEGIIVRKTDGSLWGMGRANFVYGHRQLEKLYEPKQLNGLYHWKTAAKMARNRYSLLDNEGRIWTLGSDGYYLPVGRETTRGPMAPIEFSHFVTDIVDLGGAIYAHTSSGIFKIGGGNIFQNWEDSDVSPLLVDNNTWRNISIHSGGVSAVNPAGELYTASYDPVVTGHYGRRFAKVGWSNDWVSSYVTFSGTFAIKNDGSMWVAGSTGWGDSVFIRD